ncbi:MAG: hypothetical protein H6673_12975 [Anaerolineales bacterium]|nr:hypothetical protein [Anaerolineales bacterium]
MIRVSCAALCRFMVDDRYLLLLNKNRRAKNIYELSPVGGALEFYNPAFLQSLSAKLENPDTQDLRFEIDSPRLETFRDWFYRREERETDPYREIHEELAHEANVVYDLRREDLDIRFLHITEDQKTTQRQGQTGLFTHYFLEIFEVKVLSESVKLRLKRAKPSSGVLLVSEAVVQTGQSIELNVDGAVRAVKLNTAALFSP